MPRNLMTVGVFLTLVQMLGPDALAGQAGEAHPRRAWVVGPNLEAPAILLGPGRAWVSVAGSFGRVCAGEAGCAAVAHWESSRPEEFPRGFVLRLEPALPLAVAPWPRALMRQRDEAHDMQRDPVLRPLAQAIESFVHARMPPMHNPPLPISGTQDRGPSTPPAWIQKGEGPWHWEVGFSVDPGVWADSVDEDEDEAGEGGVRFLYGGSLRVGFRYQTRVGPSSHGCIDSLLDLIWEFLAGNQYGADLRLHAWREGDRNHFAVGLQPVIRLVWDDSGTGGFERIRTFSAFGVMVPEVGYTFDNQGDKAVYVRFMEPVAIMLTADVALDLRIGAGFVLGGERDGVVGTLGLGLLFR